jgi:hypothetical protein
VSQLFDSLGSFVSKRMYPDHEAVLSEAQTISADFMSAVQIEILCPRDRQGELRVTHLPTGITVSRAPLEARSEHQQRNELVVDLRRRVHAFENNIDAVLLFINQEWAAIEEARRPAAYWTRLYGPLAADADAIPEASAPLQVWYFDGQTHFKRSPADWIRVYCVASAAPGGAFSGDPATLGTAAFAPFTGGAECYVELRWGGRNGKALRLRVHDGAVIGQSELWVA